MSIDADDFGGEADSHGSSVDASSAWWRAHAPPAPQDSQILRDADLEEMRPVVQLILEHSAEIVRRWYRLYLLSFGDSRSLSESEFARIFKPALEHAKSALINRNLEEYARQVLSLGGLLAERCMPLEEAIASLRMFEQSVHSVVDRELALSDGHTYGSFEKLSYLRIVLLVSSYFSSHSATAGEQIAAFEREAALTCAAARTRFRGLVGASAAMRALYRRIEDAALADKVLIVGERGGGGELVARAVHESGRRAGRPFVAINCAAVAPELLEDELFGYPDGALGDPKGGYLGMLRAADGGTAFVDQITEASPATQTKLARLLQDCAVFPVDGPSEQRLDIQFIAASSREPQRAAAQGHFQEALLHELRAPVIEIPPLREHREDIPLLAEHFIAVFNRRLQRKVAGVAREAMEAMLDYSWPGNLQELRDAIDSALAAGDHTVIELRDLPKAIGGRRIEANTQAPGTNGPAPVGTFAEVERDLIRRALESTRGNKVHAANVLRISRKKLYAKIEKYEL
jgi:DNA-binding NtrC family response regulator